MTYIPLPSYDESSAARPPEIGNGLDNLGGFNGGHGTRMAATISGWAPTASGGKYCGIAPKVPLLPLRITNVVLINHAEREFAEALSYAVNDRKAKVVNVSLGVFPATRLVG